MKSAPKVDADHFGFPGVIEEIEEEEDGSIQRDIYLER